MKNILEMKMRIRLNMNVTSKVLAVVGAIIGIWSTAGSYASATQQYSSITFWEEFNKEIEPLYTLVTSRMEEVVKKDAENVKKLHEEYSEKFHDLYVKACSAKRGFRARRGLLCINPKIRTTAISFCHHGSGSAGEMIVGNFMKTHCVKQWPFSARYIYNPFKTEEREKVLAINVDENLGNKLEKIKSKEKVFEKMLGIKECGNRIRKVLEAYEKFFKKKDEYNELKDLAEYNELKDLAEYNELKDLAEKLRLAGCEENNVKRILSKSKEDIQNIMLNIYKVYLMYFNMTEFNPYKENGDEDPLIEKCIENEAETLELGKKL